MAKKKNRKIPKDSKSSEPKATTSREENINEAESETEPSTSKETGDLPTGSPDASDNMKPSTSKKSVKEGGDLQTGSPNVSKTVGSDDSEASTSKESIKKLVKKTVDLSISSKTEMIAKTEYRPFAKRNGYGSNGKKVLLQVNYFKLNVKKMTIYHYDVTMVALGFKPKNNQEAKELNRDLKFKIWKTYVDKYSCRGEIFNQFRPVFDGGKNAYSLIKLNLNKENEPKEVEFREGEKMSKFSVMIKPISTGQITYDPSKNFLPDEVKMVLETAINYSLRFNPSSKIILKSSIFDPRSKYELGYNKLGITGMTTAIRDVECGIILNIDQCQSVFDKGGRLVDVIQNLIGKGNPLSRTNISFIERHLKGLFVQVLHLPYPRKYKIDGFTERPASQIQFEKEPGKKLFVKQYFELTYGDALKKKKITINDNYPCVRTSKAFLPIDVCYVIPFQKPNRICAEEVLSELIKKSGKIRPQERFAFIKNARDSFEREGKETLNSFQMEIDVEPIKVEGVILPMPSLIAKVNQNKRISEKTFIPKQTGSWSKDYILYKPVSIENCWVVVDFCYIGEEACIQFGQRFSSIGNELGVRISSWYTRIVLKDDQTGKIGDLFVKISNRFPNNKLIICIVGNKHPFLRNEIKSVGDVFIGVATQCVHEKHFQPQRRSDKTLPPMAFNSEYLKNLWLKVNARLGGINTALDPNRKQVIFKKSIMLVGIDVSHPSPADTVTRSVAAIVASYDSDHTRYLVKMHVQEPFEDLGKGKKKLIEEIVDIDKLMCEILNKYQEINKKLPEVIIIYRDGVSDGQFAHVFTHEIMRIKDCCKTFPNYNPTLSMIVVQKRHHTRFMPGPSVRDQDKLRSGNIMTGTCVDKYITSKKVWDFFLCSHEGALGTSRPSRYIVLLDENNLDANLIQAITFELCFIYGRCSKPISLPTPVQYAHLCSKRAREHISFLRSKNRNEILELQEMRNATNTEKSVLKFIQYFM